MTLRLRKDLVGRLGLLAAVTQVVVGALLVWHGWSGPHIYPFLFGIWMLIDFRLWWSGEISKAGFYYLAYKRAPNTEA